MHWMSCPAASISDWPLNALGHRLVVRRIRFEGRCAGEGKHIGCQPSICRRGVVTVTGVGLHHRRFIGHVDKCMLPGVKEVQRVILAEKKEIRQNVHDRSRPSLAPLIDVRGS